MASSLPTDRGRTGRPADDGEIDDARVATTDNGYAYGSFPAYDNALVANAAGNRGDRNGAPKPATPSGTTRALAPDLLRGLLMMIMAMDHLSIGLHTWEHGTNRAMEGDGIIVREWNRNVAYVVRTLTHFCAPGFTLLLGMGVVYLVRSRTRLGWSAARLVRYFAVRCLVLTVITVLFGLVTTGGQIWFMNGVLFALAVDYLVAGLLWLVLVRTEASLAQGLERLMSPKSATAELLDDDDVHQSLLTRGRSEAHSKAQMAESLSWHIHNVLLLVLSFVTIFWNIWLSPTHGHCQADTSATITTLPQPEDLSAGIVLARIWFWPLMTARIMNGFPPMAWLSFAILGLLYGRVLLARRWTSQDLAFGHAMVGIVFTIVFVLTRVLHFGNLSEDCLHAPEQERRPGVNPYFASVQSFFYIVKYPPDVAFWAFTLAGNFFMLAGFVAIPVHVAKRFTILLDFGTSALFFYIFHMLVVFSLGAVLVALFGHDTGIKGPMDRSSRGIDNAYAYFAIWALIMLVLWPFCRWYSRFKSTKPADSIWRFF
ncbi:hypothetical protein HJFPF1_10093 [Paramyrothecium foliicola]|nr:hypothetical protein HJFPF1_10093 [Paramyrothecium foliicola]